VHTERVLSFWIQRLGFKVTDDEIAIHGTRSLALRLE